MNPFNPVEVSHRFVESVVQEGDQCLDATVGNGHDTVFLASLVGASGKVFGYDVQELAVTNTHNRLSALNLDGRVVLKTLGHENLEKSACALKLVMFNLGYLPGSDKFTITRTDTTLVALNACLDSLAKGGAISIVAYRGHAGALDEYDAIQKWIDQLPVDTYFTVRYERLARQPGTAPVFFWVRRRYT